MPTPSLTSRLDAVNTILTACGEQPVNSLDGTTADAANAETILDEIVREVQAEGWHFNTEDAVVLTPDTSGNISLPTNVCRVDASQSDLTQVDAVQRGTRLYNRGTHTYTFSKPFTAELVYLLPFEELPETARRLIAVRAARVFHARFIGSEVEHRFTEEDESRARMALKSSDIANSDPNIFTTNPAFWQVRRRF
jgi:hypothetical protein